MRRLILLLLLTAGCHADDRSAASKSNLGLSESKVASVDLEFTCQVERFPQVSPESDLLFKYARWLQKGNLLKGDSVVNAEVERLYRVSAEQGHSKVNINLQNGSMRGEFELRGHEHLRLSQELIDTNVATGYYFVAIFLRQGSAGLAQDGEMVLRYFRKAADEGSSSAQEYVANKLAPIDIAPDVAVGMRICAAGQGNGNTAVASAIRYKRIEDYENALRYFQIAAAAGHGNGASFLAKGFRNQSSPDALYYLGQQEDLERADRYKKIWRILSNYSYANPKVPEINEIVPLPPAKLPPWDGKLQWLEERLANIPPPKPDESLIEKLAKEKGLDPATGKPLPGTPAFKAEHVPSGACNHDQRCPPERWVLNKALTPPFDKSDLKGRPDHAGQSA
ncbi:DUF6396 domain-containing protein [Pseudomonas sp. 148P]|uniref:DUF6396 domain-containing protein n=1 Tax=Pseudomonas ulcerans TaxID=3115852 RepID=A0ABU7HQE1_9PSED|nr:MULTISPECIES: DUF6396 domain-containing protein [unclassified Pseudomonas]MEE1922773.1 DUF6396 domain-containing protein [Pseudomonas sp. 147P]MEE1933750.1 DUF6396 domain-containing protein [Pseudomonas sp. 148P]